MLLLLPDDSELNSLLMAVTVDVTVFVACLVVYVVRTRHVADGPETQSLIGVSPKFSTTSSTTTATSARFYPFPVATILRQFPDPRCVFGGTNRNQLASSTLNDDQQAVFLHE